MWVLKSSIVQFHAVQEQFFIVTDVKFDNNKKSALGKCYLLIKRQKIKLCLFLIRAVQIIAVQALTI